MGFWIFMLVMNLLIPATMAGFGRAFLKKAPGKINYAFGYRTSMSMKNKDTEFGAAADKRFAHRVRIGGPVTSVAVQILGFGRSAVIVGRGRTG